MILARIFPKLACAAALLLPGMPAAAQTAAEINRLNQAVQICNSPMGAGMPECARLRGQLGIGAPSTGGVTGGGQGFGGGKGAAAAGLLGALNSAMTARQAPPAAPPATPTANPQAIAACVRDAAGDNARIQACLTMAAAPRPPTLVVPPAAGVPALGQPLMPQPGMGQNAAVGIHQAGQNYHACVAARPNDWQSCLPLLNGGQAR